MLASTGSFIVRLLWPARCSACGAGVPETTTFCPLCEVAAVPLENACPGCALVFRSARGACFACRNRPFPFSQARAAFVYGGAVADAIVRWKHGGSPAAARPLGRALVPVLDWAEEQSVDAVIPVPLHPRRLRARGFNQSLELVREASAERGARRPGRRIAIWPDALERQRNTPALGRESAPVRRCRLAGAFTVPAPERVRGRRLLLVDDVMTTGATFAECARTLLDAGASEVLVGALARAL